MERPAPFLHISLGATRSRRDADGSSIAGGAGQKNLKRPKIALSSTVRAHRIVRRIGG